MRNDFDNKIIEKITCKIVCGSRNATAFLISDNYVITATHNIIEHGENNPIALEFRNISTEVVSCEARLIEDIKLHTLPIVVLELIDPPKFSMKTPQFITHELKPGIEISVFGYPRVKTLDGIWTLGVVSRLLAPEQAQTGDWPIHISPRETAISSFDGYSGSPLLHNGKIVGIIGGQTLDDGQAITINAIDIERISDYLHKYSIQIEVEKEVSPSADIVSNRSNDTIIVMSHEISHLSTLNHKLNEDNATLLDRRYNHILELSLNGNVKEAQKELEDVLSSQNNEDKAYAKFYAIAAQWEIIQDTSKANMYINKACKLDANIDIRSYQSSMYEQSGDFQNAENVLLPISSTPHLNQWLMLQYKQKHSIDIEDVLKKHSHIEPNEGTYYCLGLIHLRTSNFDKAKEYANKLIHMHEASCVYWGLAALVYYWEAVAQRVEQEPCDGFVVLPNENMLFTQLQISHAETAMEYYQKSSELASLYGNDDIKNHALMGNLIISWMLAHISLATNYAYQILISDKGNPIAVHFLTDHQECPDEYMEDLIARTESDVFAAITYIRMLIKTDDYQQAQYFLSKYKDKIKTFSIFEWVSLQLELEARQSQVANAYVLLANHTHELQTDEVDRLTLFIMQFDDKRKKQDEIALAEKVKNSYSSAVDYENLCNIYMKNQKWHRIPRVAKEWNKKLRDIKALYYLARSQYHRGYEKKALKTLLKIEESHDLPISLKRMKVDCLTHIANYNAALEIIKQIGLSHQDEGLVIQQAKIELTKGNMSEAVRCLRIYIDDNDSSINATIMLADLLEKDSPKEAFELVIGLYKCYPENKSVVMKAIHLGFMSGNDQDAHKIMMEAVKNDPDEKVFKKLTVSNIRDFATENIEKNKEIDQKFLDGLIPQHMVFDIKNAEMGYHIYSRLMTDYKSPVFWCYGGRPDSDLTNYINTPIILDYTAILTIASLDMFELVEKNVSTIFVSSHLIPKIIDESKKLSNIQESVRKKHEQLFKFFCQRNKNIRIVDDIPISPEQDIVTPHDYVKYNTATKHNALIATDNFACEMLYQTTPPKELSDLQIYEYEVWEYLYRKGLVPKQQHGQEPREEKLQQITTADKALLIGTNFLEKLNEVTNLSDVGSVLSVFVLKSDIDMLDQYMEEVEKQEKCAHWLDDVANKLHSLEQKGFLQFCPKSDKSDTSSILTAILLDSINYADNEGIPVWVDDRCVNSYQHTHNGIILGVFDFINTLYANQLIPHYEYRNIMNKLVQSKIMFHVPPQEYILSTLKTASTMDGKNLQETDSLMNVKRYIASSLMSNSNIAKTSRSNTTLPEAHGFLLVLNRHCHDLLQMIWNDDEASQDWKTAASNWVWKYLSDFTCDVQLNESSDIGDGITTKHALLIFDSLRINPSFAYDYMTWVHNHLYFYWMFNPDNKKSVAHAVAVLLCSDRSERMDIGNLDLYEEILLIRLQNVIQPDFWGLILEDPLCKSKWGDRYKTIQVEMTSLDLPSDSNNDVIKYKPDCNLSEELYHHPDQWKDILAAVMHYTSNDALVETISFMNAYIDKNGSESLPSDCKEALEQLIWYTPPEYRLDLQELRRRL